MTLSQGFVYWRVCLYSRQHNFGIVSRFSIKINAGDSGN